MNFVLEFLQYFANENLKLVKWVKRWKNRNFRNRFLSHEAWLRGKKKRGISGCFACVFTIGAAQMGLFAEGILSVKMRSKILERMMWMKGNPWGKWARIPKRRESGKEKGLIGLCRVDTGFPGGSDGKESACNVGVLGSVPGLGRSLGKGNGYPFQCSCPVNPMDRGAWWAVVHGVSRGDMREGGEKIIQVINCSVYVELR